MGRDKCFVKWLLEKLDGVLEVQKASMDKFLSKKYVPVAAVMGDGSLRYSLEPIEKDAPSGTIEDAFWEVESFDSMFVSEGKFG